jgi:hypothetical protein
LKIGRVSGVRFTSIVLADGTRLPIHTETVIAKATRPDARAPRKIGGGAIGGAIIGGFLGGAKARRLAAPSARAPGTGRYGRRTQCRDAAAGSP